MSINLADDSKLMELLKLCAMRKDLCKGRQLHADVMKRGLLETKPHIGSALIHMYVKCFAFGKAQQVHDELPVRDIVSWNALIAGYAQNCQGYEALNCFQTMQMEGLFPNEITFSCMLKACGLIGAIDTGIQIHDQIVCSGLLQKSAILGNALVAMYAKCGLVAKAQQVFNGLHIQNVMSWSTLIMGYADEGEGNKALVCFKKMQKEGLTPDGVTFISILKACGTVGAINIGRKIHREIVARGMLDSNSTLGNALIDMYSKCGMFGKAEEVLDDLPVRDVISWSAPIAGYVQHGLDDEALNCFERMKSEGITPNDVTFLSIVKACGNVRAIEEGEKIHYEIIIRGMLQKNRNLGNALVDMYAKCGLPGKSRQLLDQLHSRDVISWSAVIAGYSLVGQDLDALRCFMAMQEEGILPNEVTYISVLKACGRTGAIDLGTQIHSEILLKDWLKNNVMLGNALLDMYESCCAVVKVQEVLKDLPLRNAVSWNILIAGYGKEKQVHKAFICFECMQTEGISPNEITSICIVNACGCIEAFEFGKQIHNEIVNRGWLEENVEVGNALVDMYTKCGVLAEARDVLEDLPLRNVVSWSSLIFGYAQENQGDHALDCFARMQMEGLSPNEVTFACILKVCGSMGAVNKGKQIHNEIVNNMWLDENVVLGTALINMYAKCGMLSMAQEVLELVTIRNEVSWNALIGGYAKEGQFLEALRCFKQMQCEGLHPDEITFICLLNACSHSGKLKEAQSYYENMNNCYGVIPKQEHYTCMVAVLGSFGSFDKAISVIKLMPHSHDASIWLALLGTCRKWGNVKLGRLIFEQVVHLDNKLGAAYVLMSDIFFDAGMKEAAKMLWNNKKNC